MPVLECQFVCVHLFNGLNTVMDLYTRYISKIGLPSALHVTNNLLQMKFTMFSFVLKKKNILYLSSNNLL